MNRTVSRIITAVALAFLIVDILGLFVPAKFGTCWLVIPDSLENAFCAETFLNEGRYGFYLNGVFHPSRYLPWFPLLFLAPFQYLSGDVYGAVYGCWFATAGLAAVMFISCRQIAVRPGKDGNDDSALGSLAGLLSFPVLLTTSFFIVLTGYAMTEVPYLLFCIWAMVLWTRLAARPGVGKGTLICCSVLIALGGAVRSSAYPMLLLPFVLIFVREKDWKRRFLLWFLCGLPTALALAASSAFNWAVFGSPFRTGYHYWCPVPYDFMALTFHPKYALSHLPRLLMEKGCWLTLALMAICAAWYVVSRRARGEKLFAFAPRWTPWEAASAFALLQGAVIFVLYIFYFYYHKRMYLPVLVMILPPAAAAAANLLRVSLRRAWAAHAVLALCVILLQCVALYNLDYYHRSIRSIPNDRAKLQVLDTMLPDNAVFLCTFNPSVADRFLLRGTHRKIIPVNRIHEYANETVAPLKVKACDPPPVDAIDMLAPGLLEQPGCFLPLPYALSDDPAHLKEILKGDAPVFFATGLNYRAPDEIEDTLEFAESEKYAEKERIVVWRMRLKTPDGERQ